MDCKEFQQYISPLVDNQIDENKRIEAEKHLQQCPSCFFDFKIESIVKKIVSFKFVKTACPDVLKKQIVFSLVSQEGFFERLLSYLKIIFFSKYLRLSFAIGLILLLSIIISNPFKKDKEKYYKEFASVVYQNCRELKNHNFPEKTIFTTNHDVVKKFISSNGILTPKMPNTDWSIIAAGIESFDKFHAAHLLFKCEEDTVYLMEFDINKAKYSGYLNFVNEIYSDLKSKKYLELNFYDYIIILRIEENILMAYAINAHNRHPHEELISSLE